jgi:CubicO group peptidase (beta-lactamase class C family)
VRYLKSYDTFRSTYIYNNLMYGLASSMTEVIGGARWEDLVRKHLFVPLGMKRSAFTTEADLNELETAKPYEMYYGNLEPISNNLPR